MKKTKLGMTFLFVISFMISALNIGAENVNAATGNQGYAIYRDGVFFNSTDHAGFMNKPDTNSYTNPIIHHSGNGYVNFDTYTGFLANNTFKGVYRPNGTVSSTNRDTFVATARTLQTEQISYNLMFQVNYTDFEVGSYVSPDEVTEMRCDGVVEYVYEWNNFKVYGNSTNWDVSKATLANKDEHRATQVTPRSQRNYLTLVQTSKP
ncbi:hypothetical protein J2T13_003035 [Paenibacillus sp. DS2015]|uniref:hypothetical protein n=1 Tax=Paenibacillus sp. DS2015 TaxID=3373917 RepID=UPI003D2329F5